MQITRETTVAASTQKVSSSSAAALLAVVDTTADESTAREGQAIAATRRRRRCHQFTILIWQTKPLFLPTDSLPSGAALTLNHYSSLHPRQRNVSLLF